VRTRARLAAFVGTTLVAGLGLAASAAVLVATARAPAFESVRAAHVSSEAELLDRRGRVVQTLRLDLQSRRLAWVPLDAVSPALVDAVLRVEDRRYHRHPGVDPLAIAAALRDGVHGRGWRGASTITMQLAAALHPPGRRGVAAKLAQARDALALELRWSKREILEAYLNRVTFRGELVGIGAAARALYGRAPAELGVDEAWVLAASLRAPGAAPDAVARRACRLRALPAAECESLTVYARARLAPPPRLAPGADLAPHLATRLLRRPGERVTSTLDADLQAFVRETLAGQLAELQPAGVRDGAAVVVDNASGEVLAYVGSAGPASTAPAVDGARALRQAGSTLKPFLYALALERRVLTAASLLDDGPLGLTTASGLYVPQNYDRSFRGPVSVRTALAGSLNVPAVRVLQLVGPEAFHRQLASLGYADLVDDPEHYGYSLALGTADVTLLQQVNAYRALANGGETAPLVYAFEPRTAAPARRRVVDPRAAWLVGDVLADRVARAGTFGLESPLATRAWTAVKTGTSKDMRDNWCIGWSGRYTVGVWVGNFEGDPMRDVSGVTGAAPVWAAIVRRLEGASGAPPPPRPDGLVARQVRFASAEPPRDEWFVAGTELAVSAPVDAGLRAARILAPADGTIVALDPDIPARLQRVTLLADPPARARWRVNGRAQPENHWSPVPGNHAIELVDERGRVLDAVRVTVRGATASAAARG
jgi:penicillin-binding protein 1C